jgi:hypothetical protein
MVCEVEVISQRVRSHLLWYFQGSIDNQIAKKKKKKNYNKHKKIDYLADIYKIHHINFRKG